MSQSKELQTHLDWSGVDVWTRSDPRSLINLVEPGTQAHFLEAAQARPDLFGCDERDLFQQMSVKPNATDNRLRLRFWDEYDRAQMHHKKMELTAVYSGVCSRQYFYERYLKAPEKVAWLLTPPATYVVKMEEALAFGIERMRDILELPLTGKNGSINVKLAELQAKIVAMMDIRVKGAVVQRVENKNMNLNISTSDETVAKKAMAGSMEEVEKRLKELERRDRVALKNPAQPVIDISND